MPTKETCPSCERDNLYLMNYRDKYGRKKVCRKCKVDLIRNDGHFISNWTAK